MNIGIIIENWWIFALIAGACFGAGMWVHNFMLLPIEEKKKRIGAFLLGLMIQAEDKFKSAEGQARFEIVLQWFYAQCPKWLQGVFTYDDLRKFAQEIFDNKKVVIESAVKKTEEAKTEVAEK
jgi:hypothetical protein